MNNNSNTPKTTEICPTTLKAGQQFMPLFNDNVYTVKSDFDPARHGCFIDGPDYQGHCTFFDCGRVRLIEPAPAMTEEEQQIADLTAELEALKAEVQKLKEEKLQDVPTVVLPSSEEQGAILERVRSNKQDQLQRFNRQQVFTEQHMADMHAIIDDISEVTIGFSMAQNNVQGLWDGYLYPNLVQQVKEVGCKSMTVALLQEIVDAAQKHIDVYGESEPCIY